MAIDVIEEAPAWTAAVPDATAVCRRAAGAAFSTVAPDVQRNVCIVLANDADVQVLNARYRGRDAATDVLSFAYQDDELPVDPDGHFGPQPLGDVILAYGVCSDDAAAAAKPLNDHLSHLVVHGILHLLGYDHVTEDDASIMEALETRILAGLGLPDPYTAPPKHDDGSPRS